VTPLLELVDLNVRYGGISAIRNLSLRVEPGEIVGLIGPNGAGKSTTLHAIMGMVPAHSGEIRLAGASMRGKAPEVVARTGIALVPEGRRIFAELTVEENLRLGAYVRKDGAQVRADIERCFGSFPRLEERRTQPAGSLSGGEQQMLAIARGLMLRPRLMLLDEPSHGLSPLATREVFKILREIVEEGTTLLIVEQNANLVLEFADHAYVLETGELVLDGSAAEIGSDAGVRRAYLGML
jgi:branched-chain amino acid transport system ATP-binding protein